MAVSMNIYFGCIMRDRLIDEMRTVFGDDQRRIDHALKVLGFADRIRKAQGGDELVVTAAAILHDIGIHEAERKYGSSAGKYQEIEGPDIARDIMEELGVDAARANHVCRIIGSHHSGGDIDTPEFRAIWDADWLVNIGDDMGDLSQRKLKEVIAKVFLTDTGRAMARERYIKVAL